MLSPPLPSMTTVCHGFTSASANDSDRPSCVWMKCSFLLFSDFILFITMYLPLTISLTPPPPHRWLCPSHAHMEAGSSHCPGASASEALLWEISPEIQACTLNANVQPHLNWKSERLWPLEQRHAVCNTDTYACNLDTQQSTHLLLLRPPSFLTAVLFLARAGTYVIGEWVYCLVN